MNYYTLAANRLARLPVLDLTPKPVVGTGQLDY